MKKLIVLVASLAVSGVFAATTGELILSGLVNTVFSITVTADPAASSLDIEGGENATKVATVAEQSNNPGGYKIRVSSDNGGKLINNTNANSFLSYQISYGGGSNLQPSVSATTVKTVASLASPANANSDVTISFTGKSDALGGTYSDRLVFEISAP